MAVFGLLTLASTASASGPLSVDISGGAAPAFGDGNHGGYSDTWISDGVYNSTSTQIYLSISGGPRTLTLDIGTGGNYSTDFAAATSSCSTNTWCIFTYPAKYYLPGKTYTFTIWDPSSSGNFFNVYYGTGNATGQRNSFGSWGSTNAVGMALQVISAEPTAPQVSFVLPNPNASTLANDFSHWQLSYTSPQGAYWSGTAGVLYGTSTLTYEDDYQTGQYNPATHTIYVAKSVPAIYATTSIWSAVAIFKDINGNIVSQSATTTYALAGWTTDFTGTTTANPGNIDMNATSSTWFVDCSAYTGTNAISADGFGCWLRKGLVGVGALFFRPSGQMSDYLNFEVSTMKNTFPMSLYWAVRDGLTTANVGGNATTTTNIAIPVWLSTTTSTPTGYITVLSRAQIDHAFGTGSWSWLMDWLKLAIWFAWGMLMVERFTYTGHPMDE